jgi:hypothetical protein
LEGTQYPYKLEKSLSDLKIADINSTERIFPKELSICKDEKAKPPSKMKPEANKIIPKCLSEPSTIIIKENTYQINVVPPNPEKEISDAGKLVLSNFLPKTSITNSNTTISLPVADNVSLDLKDDLMNILDSVWF